MKCDNCTEKCPQEELCREIAKGRKYATDEVIRLQKEMDALKAENAQLHNEAQAERACLAKRDAEVREKAIDEFAERMLLEISESIIVGMLFDNRDNSSYDTADKIVDYVIDTAKKIAEQLKGGAE